MPLSDLIFPLDKHLTLPKVPVNRLSCVWLDDLAVIINTSEWAPNLLPLSRSELYRAAIKSSGFLTDANVEKPVFYLDLSIKNDLDCSPGDTVGIYVENNETRVAHLLERLKVEGGHPCKLQGTVPSHLPAEEPTTPLFIFSICVDLDTPIKKVGFAALSKWASGQEARRLEELASREAPSTQSGPLTLPVLLESFPTLQPDFVTVLSLLSASKPRPYSVANYPQEVSIFASTDKKGKIVKLVLSLVEGGLASTYLHNIVKKESDLSSKIAAISLDPLEEKPMVLPVYLRKRNDFTLPENVKSNPLIMIATGTGIAPFIGMLEYREHYLRENGLPATEELSPWLLIHGCRDESYQIFKSELLSFVEKGVLKNYNVCFSRSPDSGKPKYVQDCLLKQKEYLIPLLLDNDKTSMMVCGEASKMVPSVTSALCEAMCHVKDMTQEEAASRVQDLIKRKRIIFDAWVL